MKALICVDIQADFMPHGAGQLFDGALAVTDGRDVIKPLVALSKKVDFVVASGDFHPTDHISFIPQGGIWPVHCVIDTPGVCIAPKIMAMSDLIIKKATTPKQEAYSAFSGTILNQKLQEQKITKLVIGGLATDYCVLHTALDAVELGYDVTVSLKASRGVAIDTTQAAINQMKAAGIKLV